MYGRNHIWVTRNLASTILLIVEHKVQRYALVLQLRLRFTPLAEKAQ
jgi:hypothetical protein